MTAFITYLKVSQEPWNKGMIIGPKPPLKLKEILGHSHSSSAFR